MVTEAAFAFDRFGQAHLDDPYPLYQKARERAGVFYADAFDLWMVTRHDDVRDVLTDTARFSSAYLIRTPYVPATGVTEILREGHPEVRILLNEDPPEQRGPVRPPLEWPSGSKPAHGRDHRSRWDCNHGRGRRGTGGANKRPRRHSGMCHTAFAVGKSASPTIAPCRSRAP